MKRILYITISGLLLNSMFSSCTDLDLVPIDEDASTSLNFFADDSSYLQSLAKIYGGLYLTGQNAPNGAADITFLNEGFTSYYRTMFLLQEFSTDEAINGFVNDETILDFHDQDWTRSDVFVRAMWNRIYYQIASCNAFISQASAESDPDVQNMVGEARFLRALSYWHGLDLYRNIPLITEEQGTGSFLPEQVDPQVMFNYIESELLELVDLLPDPLDLSYYPRATSGAANMLLAKLYLNAEVYLGDGNGRNDDAALAVNNVIASGYSLASDYDELFYADNSFGDTFNEMIFVVAHDANQGGHDGGLNYIINSAFGGGNSTIAGDFFGLTGGGWGGTRTTTAFAERFVDDVIDESFDHETANDDRANFWTQGQIALNIAERSNIGQFRHGILVTKFRNILSSGGSGSNGSDGQRVDIDFPIFRLADAYLMYAELAIEGAANTDINTAVGYINALRERAYGDDSGDIAASDLTRQFIIDERGRELYWECHRRTDLVRFEQFTSDAYLWPWKGGVNADGSATDDFRDIYPIPAADRLANPSLDQNFGY